MLRLGAMAAATPLVVAVSRPTKAFAQVAARAVPIHLELVTVSDTTATLTWLTADPTSPDEFGRPKPVPADTIVELGTSPTTMRRVVEDATPTAFHQVELSKLEPGRPYFYRCLSNGLVAVPLQAVMEPPATGTFTTLIPPPGRLLFTMAWANDLHIGEGTSGLAYSDSRFPGGGVPPGFAADPANPYWRVMTKAMVEDARFRGAELLIVNGDLTSEAEPEEVDEARQLLDRFGRFGDEWFATRGNHDRAHAGAKWAACPPAGGTPPAFRDCMADSFFPGGQATFSKDHRGVHMVALDTNDAQTGAGKFTAQQVEWLKADLKAASGRPTFVFGHHPMSEESRATAVGGPGFNLDPREAIAIEQAMAGTSVVGVYNAHTHRNMKTSSPLVPNVPFIELGAVKEYPGGFGVVRVYEGGYMCNFHKLRAEGARAWGERSRGEYLGLYPWYTLGRSSDRNFVVAADFSDAARSRGLPPGRAGTAPPGSGGGAGGAGGAPDRRSQLPSTGGGAGLAAVGAAAGAAALAARRAAARP